MGLAEAFRTQPKSRNRGPHCTLGLLLTELDDDDRNALLNALNDTDFSGVEIARILSDAGHDMGYWVVNRHRAALCRCVHDLEQRA